MGHAHDDMDQGHSQRDIETIRRVRNKKQLLGKSKFIEIGVCSCIMEIDDPCAVHLAIEAAITNAAAKARRDALDEAMDIIYKQIEAHVDDFANSVRARTVGHKMITALNAVVEVPELTLMEWAIECRDAAHKIAVNKDFDLTIRREYQVRRQCWESLIRELSVRAGSQPQTEISAYQSVADELDRILKWARDNEPVNALQITEVLRNRRDVNRIEATRRALASSAPAQPEVQGKCLKCGAIEGWDNGQCAELIGELCEFAPQATTSLKFTHVNSETGAEAEQINAVLADPAPQATESTLILHCSCGAACTPEEYAQHVSRGHDGPLATIITEELAKEK